MIDEFSFKEFELSDKVKEKLKNKKWLKKELSSGKTAQEILGYSNEVVAKFYEAAIHLFERELYVDASNAFLFLVTLNPRNYEFWLGLGMCTQMCGKFEDAIDAYEMAAICEVNSPVPYFYMAKCLFAVNDHDNAIRALDLALEFSENQSEFFDLRQQALKARDLLLSE